MDIQKHDKYGFGQTAHDGEDSQGCRLKMVESESTPNLNVNRWLAYFK